MPQRHRDGRIQAGSLRPGLRDQSALLLALFLSFPLIGCRSEQGPSEYTEPAEPVSAPMAEVPAVDPCFISSIELRAEGGGELVPEERALAWLEEGLRAREVPRRDGPAGSLRVVYLLTALEGDTGWSLGVKALWEVMDGPLRQPVSVDIARDLSVDVDLDSVAAETFEALAATLAFRCRLGTVPSDSLADLRSGLDGIDDLVAWARACGDRRVETCGDGLLGLLKDERFRVAAAAALALGQAGVEAAIPAIVERTARADPLVVRAAVLALGELGTKEARRYLRLWSEGHPDRSVQELAEEMMDLD